MMKEKLDSLQIYRGLAALSVVFYHVSEIYSRTSDNLSFFGGGFSQGGRGVDFFFVLSGFIIFFIHSKDIGRPERAKRYLLKRFFRIYPVLFIVLTGKLLYLALTGAGESASEMTPNTIISGYLLLPPDSGRNFIAVAWTLSHEVLFYSVFLLCILLGRRATAPLLAAWFVAIAITSVLVKDKLGLITSFVFNPINVEFMFGCVAGYVFQIRAFEKQRWWFIVVGLIGLALGLEFSNIIGRGLQEYIYWGSVFFFIVVGSVYIENNLAKRPPALLVTLGDASYSIYIVHSSIQVVLLKVYSSAGLLNNEYPQLMFLLFGLITVGCCLVFWFFIERPIQNKSRRFIEKICLAR